MVDFARVELPLLIPSIVWLPLESMSFHCSRQLDEDSQPAGICLAISNMPVHGQESHLKPLIYLRRNSGAMLAECNPYRKPRPRVSQEPSCNL